MVRLRRTRYLALTLTILGGLLFACAYGGYWFLDGLNWWAPEVDVKALQVRVEREQPRGGTEAETLAFIRALGFEDRYIRRMIYNQQAGGLAGRITRIEAWIPQRHFFRQPQRITLRCEFGDDERLKSCAAYPDHVPYQGGNGYGIVQAATPPPAK